MHPNNNLDAGKIAFVCSAFALVFAYGIAVGVYKIFPYHQLRFVVGSVKTVQDELPILTGRSPQRHLEPARWEGAGVTTFKTGEVSQGLTLLSGFFDDGNELRLIALDGTIVRQWPVRFHDIFSDTRHIQPSNREPATDWNIDIHGALALPDGSVVFNFEYGGMVKLDRCGAVEWTVPRMTHHSVEIDPEGGFLVSGWRFVNDPEQSASPFWAIPHHEDLILRVSATGQVIDELSVPRLLLDNGLLGVLTAHGGFDLEFRGDQLHLNDIEALPDSLASAFPGFAAGDLVISLRQLNLIAVVDPHTEELKWHQVGPWIRQHDPDFTADGTITVFDNNTDDTDLGTISGGSRLLEVNPRTGSIRSLYESATPGGFYTKIRGKHQLLVNGNMLTVESLGGRVFEVNPNGDVVWQYVNRYDAERVARINDAIRYPHEYFSVSEWTCAEANGS